MNPKNFKLHQQQNHLVVVRHREKVARIHRYVARYLDSTSTPSAMNRSPRIKGIVKIKLCIEYLYALPNRAVQMRTIIGGGNGGTNLGHLFQFAADQFSDAGALLSVQHMVASVLHLAGVASRLRWLPQSGMRRWLPWVFAVSVRSQGRRSSGCSLWVFDRKEGENREGGAA
ncbi:hypothetical protein LXL04_035229 [Taraxacum kok-saghyz]